MQSLLSERVITTRLGGLLCRRSLIAVVRVAQNSPRERRGVPPQPDQAAMPLNPGMQPYTATMNPSKYEVLGADMQIVSVQLSAHEQLQCEPGAMMVSVHTAHSRAVRPRPIDD